MNKSHFIKFYKMKYIDQCEKVSQNFLLVIKEKAEKYNLNAELLFAIIMLEKMSRDNIITQLLEKLTFYFLPIYLIKKNTSIGVGQVKITTAKEVLSNISNYDILRKLMNFNTNLDVVAKLIFKYRNDVSRDEINEEEVMRKVSNLYITGEKNPTLNLQIKTHSLLLLWSVKNRIFKEISFKNNVNDI